MVDTMVDLLEKKDHFDDIKVKTLCNLVNISEVTFFKYFERKEELLQYYMQIWNYRREVRLSQSGRSQGLDGIRSIFEDVGHTSNAIGILNTLCTFVVRSKEVPVSIRLSDCEKWVIDNKNPHIEPLSLDEQFTKHILEAIASGDLSKTTDVMNLHLLLSSLFYGGSIIAHATGKPIYDHYMDSLELILS